MAADQANPDKSRYRRWVHLLCMVFVILTFLVLNRGGEVTSRGAGLAVPDFPRVYDHNMIFFPFSLWRGNIYWEHTHRLIATAGGIMAIVVAYVLRGTQRHRPWLPWFAVGVLAAYIIQGLVGGYRVTQLSVVAAMVHGVTGQLILCATVVLAAATSRHWMEVEQSPRPPDPAHMVLHRRCSLLLATLVLQLILGVFVRHGNAALAIPDFPAAYGGLVPPFNASDIEEAYDAIVPYHVDRATPYPSSIQVIVHWCHRLGALLVVTAAAWMLVAVHQHARRVTAILWPTWTIGFLVLSQVAMGAWVVLSRRHVDTATVHHAVGAVILATSVLLYLRIWIAMPRIRVSATSLS